MSFPSAFTIPQRLRTNSTSSTSLSPRPIPGSTDSLDDTSNAISGSFISTASGHREPLRSAVHLSYKTPVVHADNGYISRSVREHTAELAIYALSDRGPNRSPSLNNRRRSGSNQLEPHFSQGAEIDSALSEILDGPYSDAIQEVSEQVSPKTVPFAIFSGKSLITNMLRRSTSSTRSAEAEDSTEQSSNLGCTSNTKSAHEPLNAAGNSERTPLLLQDQEDSGYGQRRQDIEGQELKRKSYGASLRAFVLWLKTGRWRIARLVAHRKCWDRQAMWNDVVVKPVALLPSVTLGLLLNILDALSYGMILFPLGNPIYKSLGPAGITMFYISCIVSQLVFSCGASIFKGGIGSEMIEVVPFFHKMTYLIVAEMGPDNPKAVIATTIVAYNLSSVLTGSVFYLMGKFRFGYIVGFIPRHILIGCIGGVGWFLVATGFEVTMHMNGNLEYNLSTLKKLFKPATFALWIVPLMLAVFFKCTERKVKSKYYLPFYILAIPAIFYLFVASIDHLEVVNLRRAGWIFNGPEAGEPWWYFYTLYQFNLVHWGAIAKCIPAMFALTFFGVLHVPINVPSLANATGEDNMDLDRELIAHGASNILSGLAGSVQNYLVYTNSTIVIKSGGNSRLAGIMLAFFTGIVMMIGPSTIGYIPVMMVGSLIFVLGFDLLIEAIWLPRKKFDHLECFTVVAIVLIMGMYDFVVGIFVGIGLAFVSLVVQTSRVPAVRASYSGAVARSTVRRNPTQRRYLKDVGPQIHVEKLVGYLFFGTIVHVEEGIRRMIEAKAFDERPISFLIFDFYHVTGVDYSALEAFDRIVRIFRKKGINLLMSGVQIGGSLRSSLEAAGLGVEDDEVIIFEDLNSALESCENELLKTYYASKEARDTRGLTSDYLDIPERGPTAVPILDPQFGSPRRNQLRRVAATALDENSGESRYVHFKEPLRLILQTFFTLTGQNEDFWFRAVPYFSKKEFLAGTTLFCRGDMANDFYLLQQGILRAHYDLPQGRYFESIVAGTTCGELPFLSETARTATVQAERDCVTWLMSRESWNRLEIQEPDIARELLRIGLKMTCERMDSITSYVLTTAG